jgi:hypothetical protein
MVDDLSHKLYIRTLVRVIHKLKVYSVLFSLILFFLGSMKDDIPVKQIIINKIYHCSVFTISLEEPKLLTQFCLLWGLGSRLTRSSLVFSLVILELVGDVWDERFFGVCVCELLSKWTEHFGYRLVWFPVFEDVEADNFNFFNHSVVFLS